MASFIPASNSFTDLAYSFLYDGSWGHLPSVELSAMQSRSRHAHDAYQETQFGSSKPTRS